MRNILRRGYNIFVLFGIDPRKMVNSLRGLPLYFRDFLRFMRQAKTKAKEFPAGKFYPCLCDRFSDSGLAIGDYFHQDLLIARRIFANHPRLHVDVGSRIDGFVAHVAAFRAIDVIDIRPLAANIPNVTFTQMDIMAPLQENFFAYCDSLSCLHVIEHFGLGRYGDPINYEGHLQGLDNLYRMLKKGGKFYLSVPIGPQRIEFNAHRVFSVGYLLKQFTGKYQVDQFSFVDDHGSLHENQPMSEERINGNFGCLSGCGIFELTKL